MADIVQTYYFGLEFYFKFQIFTWTKTHKQRKFFLSQTLKNHVESQSQKDPN
jgi:hypothetical protein